MTTREEMLLQVQQPEYDFLRNHPNLGNHVILLGLGGSRSYGTEIATSDWDYRGIAVRPARDILIGHDLEQVTDSATDTTIYSFDKIVKLLSSCNPNTIELLGLKPEHYVCVSDAGQALLDNRDMFLSKKAISSFGGYAKAQLNRLFNKSGRAAEMIAANETRSLQKAITALKRDGHVQDVSVTEQNGVPVIHVGEDLPVNSFMRLAQAVDAVHTDYKTSTRNNKAIEHGKLGKHQMHLTRLYLMAFDILERGEIITFREKDHDFLMDIRNGKYLTEDNAPTKEFMDMVEEWEARLQKDAETTELPNQPDYDRIHALQREINEAVVLGDISRDTPEREELL